jgi:hypothetical protein
VLLLLLPLVNACALRPCHVPSSKSDAPAGDGGGAAPAAAPHGCCDSIFIVATTASAAATCTVIADAAAVSDGISVRSIQSQCARHQPSQCTGSTVIVCLA